ncbi:MAG: M23 family metallopeptidase [Nitrospirales bacterium]|nr:M23 family metallopeptidase [Nitrospirales bacterium]
MKDSEETLTVIIFRGARANPWRLKLRRSFVKHGLIAGLVLLVLQGGILAHYVYQWKQLDEFAEVKQELTISKSRTSNFSTEVDGMKKRMVVLENLNRKLQTMFGLETDDLQGSVPIIPGQGGEEIPYEGLPGDSLSGPMNQDSDESVPVPEASKSYLSMERQIEEIKSGLEWLNQKTDIENKILEELSTVAHEKVEQWAATPSIWPTKGRITSKFGPRVSPFTGKKALHAGIDIGAPAGTEVRSPASGKVVVAAYDGRMGKFIRVDHGYGIETTYGHLSKIYVKYGDRVQRGDLIGLVGSTGKFSTGPHLHYQVAVNDAVVNPIHYILD